MKHRHLRVVAGDIGDDQREIEMEPFPASVPIKEPSPVVAPEPERVPA